ASNRVIAERTAAELGFEHLLATELELENGRYTGRLRGTPNMREGKVTRLLAWLAERGWPASMLQQAWFYSDSINDLPLLKAVGQPVAASPDAVLRQHAGQHGWPVMELLGA
ncbi:HAD family hydrolase, partial [Klebsiella pneumoniae]|uniref:HAD family hydrolase n=1 Tax=Klebsiella pneumoniae TaxID=573 RepID=UPI001C5E1339